MKIFIWNGVTLYYFCMIFCRFVDMSSPQSIKKQPSLKRSRTSLVGRNHALLKTTTQSKITNKTPQKLLKKPPKKQSTIRKLCRQETLQLPSSSGVQKNLKTVSTLLKTATKSVTPLCRKPPRKQSTIRRRAALAEEVSMIERSVGKTERQSSLRTKLFSQ